MYLREVEEFHRAHGDNLCVASDVQSAILGVLACFVVFPVKTQLHEDVVKVNVEGIRIVVERLAEGASEKLV